MKRFIIASITGAALGSLMPAAAQTDFRHITFDEAIEAAKSEGKLVFIDFYTEWCGPCKRMAKDVFPTRKVGDYMNANFVSIKIDAEKGEGPALADKYEVKAFPTFIVLGTDRNVTGSFAGYKEANEFIAKVETCRNPELSPERVTARYQAGERTPEVVNAYAVNAADSNPNYIAGREEANAIVNEYYASLTDEQRLLPANHFIFETFTNEYSNPRTKFMVDNRNRFDASKRESIETIIEHLHNSEALRYFTNNAITDETSRKAFDDFCHQSQKLGYASAYENKLRFAREHIGLDPIAYVEYCDKNFASLSKDEQSSLLVAVTRIFTPTTPEQKKAVSDFARRHMTTLSATNLYWVANALLELEGQ